MRHGCVCASVSWTVSDIRTDRYLRKGMAVENVMDE